MKATILILATIISLSSCRSQYGQCRQAPRIRKVMYTTCEERYKAAIKALSYVRADGRVLRYNMPAFKQATRELIEMNGLK